MRYLLTVEYDGTDYCGWQRQKNGRSIQEALEKAWGLFFDERIVMHSSGRTDAGVHAYAQPVHFDTVTQLAPAKIISILNTGLPADIVVKDCRQVEESFNTRFDAKSKTYEYVIYNAAVSSAFIKNRAVHIKPALDLDKMKKAATYIEGTHDFKAFCASGTKVKDFVRTVYSIDLKKENEYIKIRASGSGFLYNMVRIIAGTLVYVGMGKLAPEDLPEIILSRDRKRAGKTLPPQGLYLVSVEY